MLVTKWFEFDALNCSISAPCIWEPKLHDLAKAFALTASSTGAPWVVGPGCYAASQLLSAVIPDASKSVYGRTDFFQSLLGSW